MLQASQSWWACGSLLWGLRINDSLWSLFGFFFFSMYIGNEWLQDIILGNCFLFIINNFPLCGWKWKPSAVYGVPEFVAGWKKKGKLQSWLALWWIVVLESFVVSACRSRSPHPLLCTLYSSVCSLPTLTQASGWLHNQQIDTSKSLAEEGRAALWVTTRASPLMLAQLFLSCPSVKPPAEMALRSWSHNENAIFRASFYFHLL